MVAASRHTDIATKYVPQADVTALPVTAIYGANASGKSNVVEALVFMRGVVLASHQTWRPGESTYRRPFKLDAAWSQRPTTFTANFTVDGEYFEYGFSLDDHRIVKEWLYGFPKKRTRVFFVRTGDDPVVFGPSLKGLRQNIASMMRPNSLYLSAAAANNHPQLTRIYKWFEFSIFPVRAGTSVDGTYTLHEWQHHDQTPLRDLLRYADTGVIDIKVEEQEMPANVAEKFQEFLKLYDPESTDEDRLGMPSKIEFVHRSKPSAALLDADEESSGTLAWIRLIGPAVAVLRRSGVLVVDELDAHLHPVLAAHLVSIFQDPKKNPSGAQLLFNTHNVALLAPSAPRRLRRDQVWFTEKDDDGVTVITPLSDYQVRDGLENVEKRYLDGRYGAIPFLDDSMLESIQGELENVAQGKDSLKRRAPKLKQHDRFLVYAEGDVTESIYLKGVRRDLGRRGPRLEIGSTHGEPLGLVNAAIKHQTREKAAGDAFDQVWCVFDVESPKPHQSFHQAVALAKRNKVKCGITNPCFELWLILHSRLQSGWLTTDDACNQLVGLEFEYDKHAKSFNYELCKDKQGDAAERADALGAGYRETAPLQERNPWTSVQELFRALRDASSA
jgi:AAA15 family ATPase/GTPase